MRKILTIFIMLFLIRDTYSSNNIENISLIIKGHELTGITVYNAIDRNISKNSNKNLIIKKELYINLINGIDSLESKIGKDNTINLKEILYYGLEKTVEEIEKNYSKVKKIILGYTETGKEINAYYKGNPEKGFFGIFADIHGGYEYGSYNTALFLLEELNKSGKTGWFIIPTINPEGLDLYLNAKEKKNFYVKGRTNKNNVDINRNFCTKSFELKTFIKNGEYIETGIGGCNSEMETKIIIETLKKHKFNQIVTLHSEGNIFFLPENSFDDEKITDFGAKLHELLPSFDYNLSYSNDFQKEQKIYEYEIDEGGSKLYTGTMVTYIYEKYNIPVILIELKYHGRIEYELKNLINFLK